MMESPSFWVWARRSGLVFASAIADADTGRNEHPIQARSETARTYLAPNTRVPPPTVEGLSALIQRAYVQTPPLFFANERSIPPFWNDKFRVRVPVDVAEIMRATAVMVSPPMCGPRWCK